MNSNPQSSITVSTQNYLNDIARYFQDENSSEMTYRAPFQNWLEQIFPKESGFLIQHDQRSIKGNKPDFIVKKDQIPLLYVEVKKLGEDLDKIAQSSQASRYFGYTNLIITDYLDFRFFRNGHAYDEPISLGLSNKQTKTIMPTIDQSERLVRTMIDFISSQKEPIKSGKHLAKIMGGKAQRIRDNVIDFLKEPNEKNSTLFKLKQIIQDHLVSELGIAQFADMYAQTLVYGLFAARYQDSTLKNFSRQEARDLVPPSNPFLQHFFDHIAGASFPTRLDIIVSELCEVFLHADVRQLITSYYKSEGSQVPDVKDPIIHFYEDFLSEYDATKKMEMGVFYTPQPVVRFIVRSVDELLREKLSITAGLADSNKTSIITMQPNAKGKLVKVPKEYHQVQVLDFATGTGTFLNEVVQFIHTQFIGQEGRWPAYVTADLLPRLHGFELMMASYTIAHLKLALTLKQTGVQDFGNRLGIYLTNTLEESADFSDQRSLFGLLDSIAEESRQASRIKSEVPVMVVIGNPPYSGESLNPHYHEHDVYKVEPGGKQKLQEKNSKWLNDDYVKFIRFAESLIEKNKHGVIGVITAHGYIDNPTFRGMRWHLRQTFDEIYVVDLHGNTNKKETTPEGKRDENVFDIKTGVSILLAVKKATSARAKRQARVHSADLFGLRREKFEFLEKNSLNTLRWNTLPELTDIWKKVGAGEDEYKKGFSVRELFPVSSVGIVTSRDEFIIDVDKVTLENRIKSFLASENANQAKVKFGLKENQKWKIENVLKHEFDEANIRPIAYRPFDTRFVYYHDDFIERSRSKVMSNFLMGENVGLVIARSNKNPTPDHFFLSQFMTEAKLGESSTQSCILPLYLYFPDDTKQPNINTQLWTKLTQYADKTTQPEDVLDYVYAYLYSPTYRKIYKDFLKTDFPHVPWPKNSQQFWQLIKLGRELHQLHLMSPEKIGSYITTYSKSGDDIVRQVQYDPPKQQVWINDTQYFGQVPKEAWEFHIGGYQPAEKWLKDRKNQKLNNSDLDHYQKIITVLTKTNEIMQKIDEVIHAN